MIFNKPTSIFDRITGISGIVTATLLCIRLAYAGIISVQTAALIIVGVVIFNALGSNVIKIIQSIAAVWLFSKVNTNSPEEFREVIFLILQLGIVLLGIYIMVKGLFRKSN